MYCADTVVYGARIHIARAGISCADVATPRRGRGEESHRAFVVGGVVGTSCVADVARRRRSAPETCSSGATAPVTYKSIIPTH